MTVATMASSTKFYIFLVLLALYLVEGKVPSFQEAKPCSPDKCQPPNCRCSDNFEPPGKLAKDSTPQIIMITFDDDLNVINYQQYLDAFEGLLNPNGCPAVGTFFICHNYTNYFLSETMYSKGHELADHTVTHQEPTEYWIDATYDEWKNEINGQREILHRFAGVSLASVAGFRAPFLAIAENMYKALYLNNFTYDLSWPTGKYYKPPMYPYTLDYKSIQDCNVGVCPVMSYPGLWVVPNVDLMNADGTVCGSMMDACAPTANASAWYDILIRNFGYHYDNNRAPFGMHAHSAWFSQATGHMEAMKKFLAYVTTEKKDVWILTVSQVIDWMKNPQDVNAAKKFAPWGCPSRPKPRCSQPHSCHYTVPKDFYMPTCTDCPPHFPSPTDPDGN